MYLLRGDRLFPGSLNGSLAYGFCCPESSERLKTLSCAVRRNMCSGYWKEDRLKCIRYSRDARKIFSAASDGSFSAAQLCCGFLFACTKLMPLGVCIACLGDAFYGGGGYCSYGCGVW